MILREVLVAISGHCRVVGVRSSKLMAGSLAVGPIRSSAVLDEVGRLMDDRSALGVGSGDRSLPVSVAEVNMAELVAVDVGVETGVLAGAVVSIGEDLAVVQVLEVRLHSLQAGGGERAKPLAVTRSRLGRDLVDVWCGLLEVLVGLLGAGNNVGLLLGTAADILLALVERVADDTAESPAGGEGAIEIEGVEVGIGVDLGDVASGIDVLES